MTATRTGLLAMLALLILPMLAWSHEISMAEMELRQVSRSEFLWQWIAGGKTPANQVLRPQWPEGCSAESNQLKCGEAGLSGKMSMAGIGKEYSAAIMRVYWLDGQSRVYTMTSAQPAVRLYGSADDRRGVGEIASAYTILGIEHILSGVDHLLFVAALLLLVGFNRRLLWTITAFTVAHSLTLALSALGLLSLRPPPVEACIALSIVLVTAEALRDRLTLARRWPALVAFLFGLVHGLGFAGALKDIGLPEHHLSVALLSFNVGVELGQLMVITFAYGLSHGIAALELRARARRPLLYAIGTIAAYWSIARVLSLLA